MLLSTSVYQMILICLQLKIILKPKWHLFVGIFRSPTIYFINLSLYNFVYGIFDAWKF